MELFEWIEMQGGISAVSKKLKVQIQTVYAWKYRRAQPRGSMMYKLVEMSKGKLTYASIIEATRKKKPNVKRS